MWLQRAWYRFVWVVVSALAHALCRIEKHGWSYVPETGPLIMVSNHLHLFDPPLVLAGIPYREGIKALVAEKWGETWPANWLLKSMGSIFVHRGEVDRKALNQILAELDQGGIVGLAPEGTRSRTGTMQRAKPGVAYLAIKADVPVLPIGVSGQNRVISDWMRLRRPRVVVRIGQPFKLEPIHGRQKSQQLQARSDEVMRRIAVLVDEELRGVYTESAREIESTV